MKNSKLIIALSAFTIASSVTLYSCKKEIVKQVSAQNTNSTNTTATAALKEVTYNLNEKETYELIKRAKSNFSNTTHRTVNNDLPLDSSVWVLEALVNFDFDKQGEITEIKQDSLTLTAPINNGKVSANDFETTYLSAVSALNQKLVANLNIQAIDVKATVIGGNIEYKLAIVLFSGNVVARLVTTPCDPFTNEVAAPSKQQMANPFVNCAGYASLLDGPQIVQTKLNAVCSTPAGSFFYTNLQLIVIPNCQNAAYYRVMTPGRTACDADVLRIEAPELNSYIPAMRTLANSYITAPQNTLLSFEKPTFETTTIFSPILMQNVPLYHWKVKFNAGTKNTNPLNG